MGRAAEGVLQRPHGTEPEAAVDGTDRVVGRLAGSQLRRAGRRSPGHRRDRLLLRRRRARVARPRVAPAESRRGLIMLGVLLALLVFAITRTKWRPAAPLRVARRSSWGQIVSAAGRMYVNGGAALHRARDPLHPAGRSHLRRAGGSSRRLRPARGRAPRARPRERSSRGRRSRHDARRCSASGSSRRRRRARSSSSTRASRSARRRVPFGAREDPAAVRLHRDGCRRGFVLVDRILIPCASGSPSGGRCSRRRGARGSPRARLAPPERPSSCVGAGSASARSSASGRVIALLAGPLLGALLIFVTDALARLPEHPRRDRLRARAAVRRARRPRTSTSTHGTRQELGDDEPGELPAEIAV